ncbi:helix-turn-helix domain-containing protein [Methanospirillum sp. J.3.6.1-F.2.7.3]|uniref:Helix-turn-helix domain-containing protein n=1 Tax=Methanospirillum purgamenti TaxID=2834276 RepID=A0A8E7EK68_9EURY|nr:helix-turn-helix domain-containing protein [Methanospirillum sp. J.3.6.1-F.2.7.3]
MAKILGHSVKTIEKWVNLFNQGSFQALRDKKRTGRHS